MRMLSCPECRIRFVPRRVDQGYCSAACNRDASGRELTRARRLYRALYWWRYSRTTSGPDLLFICREIASWVKEDREHQRKPPPRHDHMADRGHQRRPREVRLMGRKVA